MISKRWIQKELPDQKIIKELQESLNVSEVLASLIAQRGIMSYSEARNYFNPSRKQLHDPFLMKDMNKAVDRILKALEEEEAILVYGDYDVDGTTSVGLVYRFFSQLHKKIYFYVPDRFSEGYGISSEGIKYAEKQGVTLMIALDCGIKDERSIMLGNEKKIDIIVCDHHTVGEQVPPAYAILNPKQRDCNYPYKELSGCGIGYKLIDAFHKKTGLGPDPISYVDYVAVSIASDIVPITGENRILEFLGLEKLNTNPSIPFRAMLEQLSIKKTLDVSDLVFIIGPRLNASGRVKHAETTIQLLLAGTYEEAIRLVPAINDNNSERKDLDKQIADEAFQKIISDESLINRKTTVLWDPNWHKGVVGIVASRLIEHFYRPTILLTESEGLLTGSARSVSGFNLYEALEKCSEYLERFGGHQFAAGLTLKKENFELFADQFEKVVGNSISDDSLVPVLNYDLEIDPACISMNLIRSIQRLGPFGPGNMKPKFVTRNVQLADKAVRVGANHLKFSIRANGKGTISAIAFGMADILIEIKDNSRIDLCYTLEENIWNGNSYVQMNVKDIHLH